MRACHEGSSAAPRCQRAGCGGRSARRTPRAPLRRYITSLSTAGAHPGHVETFGGRHVGTQGGGAGCAHGAHGGGAGFPQLGPGAGSACSSHLPSRTPMLPFTFRGPAWKDDADELACCSFPAAWPAAWTVTPVGGPSYACVIVWRVRLAFPASDTAVELFDWPTPPGCGAGRPGVVAGASAARTSAASSVPEPCPICWSSPFRFAAAASAVDVLSWRVDPESPPERFVFSGATCTDDAQQTTADCMLPAS